jgi:hypothetical protein
MAQPLAIERMAKPHVRLFSKREARKLVQGFDIIDISVHQLDANDC